MCRKLVCLVPFVLLLGLVNTSVVNAIDISTDPDPNDGVILRDTFVSISWVPGDSAASHDVYVHR